jgi:glutaredoxin-related protein
MLIYLSNPLAFPQIILNGQLIGGLDIFKESLESGEWDEMYDAEPETEQ